MRGSAPQPATRRSTILSSKVDVHHAMNFRAASKDKMAPTRGLFLGGCNTFVAHRMVGQEVRISHATKQLSISRRGQRFPHNHKHNISRRVLLFFVIALKPRVE